MATLLKMMLLCKWCDLPQLNQTGRRGGSQEPLDPAQFLRGLFSCFCCFRKKKRDDSSEKQRQEETPVQQAEIVAPRKSRKVTYIIDIFLHKTDPHAESNVVHRCCDFTEEYTLQDTRKKAEDRQHIFNKTDPSEAIKHQCEAACLRKDQCNSKNHWEEVTQMKKEASRQQDISILETLESITTLFQRKQSGEMTAALRMNKNSYGMTVRAVLEDNFFGSFSIKLAGILTISEISKVPPFFDPPVESKLLEITIFVWMSCMAIEDEVVSKKEKLLLQEAFGVMLRGLLRQAPTSQHLVFLLKHFEKHGLPFFIAVLQQLISCAGHHPQIDLTEVQKVFPQVPPTIWDDEKCYGSIIEDDLVVKEL